MSVTTSYSLTGDEARAESLLGFAYLQLSILLEGMKFQNLKQNVRTVILSDNSVIRCTSYFGTNRIEIYSPVVTGGEEEIEITEAKEYYLIHLISTGVSYGTLYKITDKIERVQNLYLTNDPYEHSNSYWGVGDEIERYVESCASVQVKTANTAAEPFWYPVTIKNDWHQKQFTFVGYPYWFAAGGVKITDYSDTWAHPGVFAIYRIHWNISAATDGTVPNYHMLRTIDHEKRIYRPLVTEWYGDLGQLFSITTANRIYGKTSYTKTKQGTIERTLERVHSTGNGTSNYPAYPQNWLMYFFPFVPYLWEIPGFSSLLRWNRNESVYGQCMTPEKGTGLHDWSYSYFRMPDETEITNSVCSDSANFSYSPEIKNTFKDPRPVLWEYFPGDPWPHNTGQVASGSWTDSTDGSSNWSVEVIKSQIIGPVCNGDILRVENNLTVCTSSEYNTSNNYTKDTNMPDVYYTWRPIYPNYGWGSRDEVPCDFYEKDTATLRSNKLQSVNGTLSSKVYIGDTVALVGNSSMSFTATYTENTDYVGEGHIIVYEWRQPFDTNRVRYESSGYRTDLVDITSKVTREMNMFDILDYNAESTFTFYIIVNGTPVKTISKAVAFVYKDITNNHVINRKIVRYWENYDQSGHWANRLGNPGGVDFDDVGTKGPQITDTDTIAIDSTRKVVYKLYFGIPEYNIERTVTLATFDCTLSSASGYRCHGIDIKFFDSVLFVTYDYEKFEQTGNVDPAYDSARNYEDWYVNNAGEILWKNEKRVIYILKYDEQSNDWIELLDEQEPVNEEYYGIGIRKVKFSNTRREKKI